VKLRQIQEATLDAHLFEALMSCWGRQTKIFIIISYAGPEPSP